MQSLRETAIAAYHELLAADETLTAAMFQKLRSAMRKSRLLYGDRPIGVVDWKNLPTSSEFVFLQEHFSAQGVRTIICSPDDLEYQNEQLRCGAFRITLVYKRVIIHEFLARYDDTHPLIRAYLNHDVCLVNPFRCKIMHKKAVFEMLTDEQRLGSV
jgi:hypothetical protein